MTPSPAPVPSPAVTVSETIFVTPSPHDIDVRILPDPLDFWRDIVFNDFGGAVIGVFGAATVAWWLTRREREARLDERRRDQIAQLSAALRELCRATPQANLEIVVSALEVIAGAAAPLIARSGKTQNTNFQRWLVSQVTFLSTAWVEELRRTEEFRVEEKVQKRRELVQKVILMQANIERWSVNPNEWRPIGGGGPQTMQDNG